MEPSVGTALVFRPFLPSDKEDVISVWRDGRESLYLAGIDQWQKGDYPGEREFLSDKESGEGVAVVLKGKIVAAFAISPREEEDYSLPCLKWKGTDYLSIHRSAVLRSHRGQGIMGEIISYAQEKALSMGKDSIRVDTHGDNKAMQSALGKAGFEIVGRFLLSYGPEKGDQRIAMEKVLSLSLSDKKKSL